VQFRWAALLGIGLVVFLSIVPSPSYADNQTRFFRRGSFEPVGIDFGVVSAGLSQVARMYVTRPFDGNPREVVRRNEADNNFTLLSTLPTRPSNQVQFSDSVAVVPSVLGEQEATGGGYLPGDVLITQGLFVYLIRDGTRYVLGSGGQNPTINPNITACEGTALPNAISTAVVIDRWELEFEGAAIVTCTRQTDPTNAVWEAWRVKVTGVPANGAIPATAVLIASRPFLATGRPDITSPNFTTPGPNPMPCGGCIAVLPDFPVGSPYVALLDGDLATGDLSITLVESGGPALPIGRKHALTIPARFRNFGNTGSCLFGTVPADNSILQFACDDGVLAQSLMGFPADAGAGDLLIFAAGGSVWLVDGETGEVDGDVHPGAGVYEDLSFSPVKQVLIQVGRTSQDDPNPGGNTGKIKFYILTGGAGSGFTDPLSVIDQTTLLFGATGTEDSNVSCKNVGTDVNGDGFPDPMCQADAEIANCDAPLFCILTGVTENPSAFEGGD